MVGTVEWAEGGVWVQARGPLTRVWERVAAGGSMNRLEHIALHVEDGWRMVEGG